MSYQVLARKYRPQNFDDVIAQEHVTRTLKNAIKSDRVSSGYLFTGPRGTGKTTTARILAKALNCADGPTPDPCGKCDSCREITAGSSLDVLEIDAASNTGVDDIRALRENVRYLPTSGKKRIYIIDEVHRLSGSAFDALLKTLEEPPSHVVFMFATTEPHKVPETIRSRTQRHDLHRVSTGDLAKHLRKISDAEKLQIDDEAIYLLAQKADGSVRDGMSLLDQISAFAGEKIDRQAVVEGLGLIDRELFFKFVDSIAAKDVGQSLELVYGVSESGGEATEFVGGLAQHFRNLMILKNANEPERLLDLSESEMESYKKQVDYFSTGDILRILKLIANIHLDLKSGMDERLILETGAIRLASLESTVLFEDILAHLNDAVDGDPVPANNGRGKDLFGTPSAAAPTPASNTEAPPPASTREAPDVGESVDSFPSGKALNLALVKKNWPRFIDLLKKKNQMLSAILAMAELKEVKGNLITVVFYNSGGTSKQVVEKTDYNNLILETLKEYFDANIKISFEVDMSKKKEIADPSNGKIESVDTNEILEKDKKLKSIVDRFNGEIIGKKQAK